MNVEQHPYNTWIDLVSRRLGGQTLDCSDDFFAEMENLLKPEAPVFIFDKYTDRGKWMDGWESRRKRVVGHDWCVIKLGAQGIIHGVNVCTRHFAGNAPQKVSIEACYIQGAPLPDTSWVSILETTDECSNMMKSLLRDGRISERSCDPASQFPTTHGC